MYIRFRFSTTNSCNIRFKSPLLISQMYELNSPNQSEHHINNCIKNLKKDEQIFRTA